MKNRIYTLLLVGIIIMLGGCKEDGYENLIPQKYEKILYLKTDGQQSLSIFNDGTNVDYTVIVGKTGSKPEATAEAKLQIMTQAEIDRDEHYTGNHYVVLSSDCYHYTSQQLNFVASETYKSVKIQLIPDNISKEIKESTNANAVFILPFRLSSQTDSVNTARCDLILKPTVTDLGIAFKKDTKTIDLNTFNDNSITMDAVIAMVAGVKNTWDFEAGVELLADLDGEILKAYNAANSSSYLMLPAAAVENIESAVFESGNNEAAATITVLRDKLSKGHSYLIPLKLKPIEGLGTIKVSDKIFYGIAAYEIDMEKDKIALDVNSINDVFGWLRSGEIKNLFDNAASTHMDTNYGLITGNATYGTPMDVKIGKEVNSIKFRYITRANNATVPGDMSIWVSNDDDVLINKESTAWTCLGAATGLPVQALTNQTYTSSVFSSSTPFKYLRIAVKKGNGPVDGTQTGTGNCWTMAEFSLWAY